MRPYRPVTPGVAAVPPYRAVVEASYTVLDMLIGRIVELAGPGAAVFVVSPYGFGSGPAAAHMGAMLEQTTGQRLDSGVVAAAGPAFASDALVHGAMGFDIVPTLLHHFDLPVGRGRKYLSGAGAVADAVLGGWQLAGINTIQAGDAATLRYTPSAAQQVSGIQQDFRGANAYRPNVIGEVLVPSGQRGPGSYLSRETVIAPTDPSQPFGNAPRNSVRGPNFWQFDFAASKRFALGGPARFEFRFEAFNLLNHTNFRAPNGNRSAAGFGTITSTFDPRQLQFGFKVLW